MESSGASLAPTRLSVAKTAEPIPADRGGQVGLLLDAQRASERWIFRLGTLSRRGQMPTNTVQYEPGQLAPEEIARLHALPDEALVTPREACEILRLKLTTLSYYRCNRPDHGPRYVRVGARVRYTMGALREYASRQEMPPGPRRSADAMLAARRAKGLCHG
jgi:hypothetical protein